jgi:ribonuclease P protein component
MVSKGSRLPYEEFRARGYRGTATPYFLVKAKKNSLKKNRFGVIITASLIKSAARRNFWRRQAKSTFLSLETPPDGFDVFVVLRSRLTLPQKNTFKEVLGKSIISAISHL